MTEVREQKIEAENTLREKLKERNGFLQELSAMVEILGENVIALVFYIVLFTFLLSIELFILISKTKDKKCDYEMVIEHQLNVRSEALHELAKKNSGNNTRG